MRAIAFARGLCAAATLAVCLVAPSGATAANTLTVTNNTDSDPGSLRDRVVTASAGDTVVIPAAIGPITLASQIPVTKSLTIQGAGAATTSVSGNDSTRVFCVQAPDCTTPSGTQPSLSLSGMTITHGKLSLASSTTATGGGGIFVGGGTLTLADVTVTNSNVTITTSGGAAGGGGVYMNGGTLNATNSHIDNNTVNIPSIGVADGGGGLYANGATLLLTGSTVDDNSATLGASNIGVGGGGGIYQNGGPVTLTSSHVDNNTATVNETSGASNYGGGGLYSNGGSVMLTGSTASGNTADLTFTGAGGATSEGGGGIYANGGGVSLISSTLDANTLTLSVEVDLNASGGGALFTNGGAWTLSGTTLSANSADLSHGAGTSNQNGGGAVFNQGGGAPTLTNSTLADNSLTVTGAGTNQGGGALLNAGGQGTVTNLTIAGNTASNTVAGGVFAQGGTLQFKNTIFANTAPTGANCVAAAGTFTSSGHNLESANTCGLGAAELRNTNPLLGTLANNGGPTQTEALLNGSPAIDAATGCPATDQRGVSRPQGPACDIGAFELAKPAPAVGAASPTPEGCVRREISLVTATIRGRFVVLTGLVQPQFAGQQVRILANSAGAKTVALKRLATVRSNAAGEFTARVKKPRTRAGVIKARYRAQVSRFRSFELKLPQALSSSSVRALGAGPQGQQIELRGKVKRALLGRRNPVIIKRLVCGRYRTVGQARPARNGKYVARFTVPANVAVAFFRAEARVLNKPGGRTYTKQYARAISITLTGQTG